MRAATGCLTRSAKGTSGAIPSQSSGLQPATPIQHQAVAAPRRPFLAVWPHSLCVPFSGMIGHAFMSGLIGAASCHANSNCPSQAAAFDCRRMGRRLSSSRVKGAHWSDLPPLGGSLPGIARDPIAVWAPRKE